MLTITQQPCNNSHRTANVPNYCLTMFTISQKYHYDCFSQDCITSPQNYFVPAISHAVAINLNIQSLLLCIKLKITITALWYLAQGCDNIRRIFHLIISRILFILNMTTSILYISHRVGWNTGLPSKISNKPFPKLFLIKKTPWIFTTDGVSKAN